MTILGLHPADGSDSDGEELPIIIRLGPDGTLYFHDLTAKLLSVAAAMCPDDNALQSRIAAAQAFEKDETQ